MDTTAELTWTPDLQLLTASEAAQLLKVSPKTVYVMIAREEIASVHFGKSVRIRKEDLENFINSHLVGNNG